MEIWSKEQWYQFYQLMCVNYQYHSTHFDEYMKEYLNIGFPTPNLEIYCYQRGLDPRVIQNQIAYAKETSQIACNQIPYYLGYPSYARYYNLENEMYSNNEQIVSKTYQISETRQVA